MAKVKPPTGATDEGVLQLEANLYWCEKHLSPPGLEPGSLYKIKIW